MTVGIFSCSGACLSISSPREKCRAVTALWVRVEQYDFVFDPHAAVVPIDAAGRPDKPELVAPSALRRRRLGSAAGRAALAHAVAHIEFNAINLALDAVHRFRDMPRQYYIDWVSVAADEARHFQLMQKRLGEIGHAYGDFPAHDGLWEMARQTAGECLYRMALVPRVLEARGLDVTPGMIERLERAGDDETVRLLKVILAEEVRHVEIGSHWFRLCCDQRGLDSEATFLALLAAHRGAALQGPFNLAARVQAGFTQRELGAMEGLRDGLKGANRNGRRAR